MRSVRKLCAGVVWSRVEDDFHVASRRDVFIGYVDRRDGNVFLAFDRRPHLLGRFATLPLAMTAVLTAQSEASPAPETEIVLTQVRHAQREISHG